jgi:N-acetyl-gamma-glutamyl-phosphate reductase
MTREGRETGEARRHPAVRAAVVGASGYTGAELLRLLAGHPDVEVAVVTADANAGSAVAGLYPSLAGAYPELVYERFDAGAVAGLDVVFMALPHGQSQRMVPSLVETVGHLVDLASDFRLPEPVYRQWYGEDHEAPALLDRFVFGLPELFRADVVAARHVAAPGCYPTAAALALAPLLAHGLVEPTGIVVDAASGVSGAGRGLKASSLFSEIDAGFSAYGLLEHRHTAEMELALSHVAGRPVQVLFTPHLVPMVRGILTTCYARPAVEGLSTASLLACYREFYAGEPFVVVGDDPPPTKATLGSNAVHLTVRNDSRTGTVLALGAIDNLVKGASGQAIQCANLVLGLPETTGLSNVGMMP